MSQCLLSLYFPFSPQSPSPLLVNTAKKQSCWYKCPSSLTPVALIASPLCGVYFLVGSLVLLPPGAAGVSRDHFCIQRWPREHPGNCSRNEVEPSSVRMLPGGKKFGCPAESIVIYGWNLGEGRDSEEDRALALLFFCLRVSKGRCIIWLLPFLAAYVDSVGHARIYHIQAMVCRYRCWN